MNGIESLAIASMALTGLLLLNEDVLYPFVADNPHNSTVGPRTEVCIEPHIVNAFEDRVNLFLGGI